MNDCLDGYQLFFEQFIKDRKQEFFDFGLENIIFANKKKAQENWSNLKHSLLKGELVYIRSYGRGGVNTPLYQLFYAHIFDNENIKPDPTNNSKPRQLLEHLTGYAKKERKNLKPIQNFQVSHVFGRTKNALAFTAPWNVVYLPKILDPFTGHEAKGDSVNEFKKMFQKKCFEEFEELILDFNDIMETDFAPQRLEDGINHVAKIKKLNEKQRNQFKKSVISEFQPINLD